jgi:pimeloyl-ACP methyl ester carboxylesterase
MQTLRQLDLDEIYARSPSECLIRLQTESEHDLTPELLFALAELSYQIGLRAESSHELDACVFYYLCAGYAYHYLFDFAPVPEPHSLGLEGPPGNERRPFDEANPFDPRYRLACDLYNAALAQCIRTAQRAGRLDPREKLHLRTPNSHEFVLTIQHHGFAWGPEEFGPLLFCADFQTVGLANQYRRYGLGVPLIGNRVSTKAAGQHAFYPDAVSFPVSAFFRFEGSVADLHRQSAGTLELYNPLNIDRITVRDRAVPLETDLTTPLAYFLSRSDLQEAEYEGFVKADKVQSRAGIYMLEPYQPGKIPVLMVHGLFSSPLTWAPLFNDLRADPELRRHFQFWFYLYPTGPGYLQAAADLRRDLAELYKEVDPDAVDSALDEMVLVGHSMGGLVSRLMTVNSGDDFWRLVSNQPLRDLELDTSARNELRRICYFQRQPTIKRVVFIATPHRGSQLSLSTPGRLADKLVTLPRNLLQTSNELMNTTPDRWGDLLRGPLATSIDLLSPDSPVLKVLAAEPRPNEVQYHSIIGRAQPRTLMRELTRPFLGNEPNDGAVTYSSAHLGDVASEIVVPADHNEVHHHPLAVREVRRILLEHLSGVNGGVTPAGAYLAPDSGTGMDAPP